jgi:hypothetical protein
MEKTQKPIEQLTEIRNMMERSSRFISLSGLSGIAAGIIALIGSGVAFLFLGFDQRYFDMKSYFNGMSYLRFNHSWHLIILDASTILILALASGIFFTTRKARNKLMASWLPGYGLLFWAFGFGVMHIFYGVMMYFRYEAVRSEK